MMVFSQSKEMYLKEIYRLLKNKDCVRVTDVAEQMAVSKASVTNAVKKLSEEGYISYIPYKHISLTPAGFEMGKRLCERQKILTIYLMNTLLIDEKTAFDEACRLEHVTSPSIIERIKQRYLLDYKN